MIPDTERLDRRRGDGVPWICALVVAFLFGGRPTSAESIVIAGAGSAGTWTTELTITNGTDTPQDIFIAEVAADALICASGTDCDILLTILPYATVQPDLSPLNLRSVVTLYVSAADENDERLPSVRARVVNSAVVGEAIELPIIRQTRLIALQPSRLSFPGASLTEQNHSNLLVASILPLGPNRVGNQIQVHIQAYTTDGASFGSIDAQIDPLFPLFLPNILTSLGASSLSLGQVQVTKTGGGGLLWGVMSTLAPLTGDVAVSQGLVP